MEDISLITYLACIISRLVYFDNTHFLEKYTQIMDIKKLSNQLEKIKKVDQENIFTPKTDNLLEISRLINKINYKKTDILDSKHVKYIIISTSNFSSVYLIADKMSNTIFIGFRGTSSVKSALSYLKLTSIIPFKTCNKNSNGYLLGIFKIVGEIFYTISEGINFLSNNFLDKKNIKLITTGQSLGGGCAQIFSYLWIKLNPSSSICCITFGSPRVMNGSLIKKYINLINKGKIQFKRVITYGYPFVEVPFNRNYVDENKTYFHVDDMSKKLKTTMLICNNYKKTKKLICNVKNKTKRVKKDIKSHGNYLSINYDKAAQGLTDLKKEIHRGHMLDTVCRIIIGGNNDPSSVSFYNLQKIKTPDSTFIESIKEKLSKKILTDYKHQDIYMNTTIFNKLLKKSIVLNDDNTNPTLFTELVEIKQGKPNPELYCV